MDLLPLLALPVLAAAGVVKGATMASSWIVHQVQKRRRYRRDRIEAELNRKEAELRLAVFTLASQLGADAHEARKDLIRASYLASRRIPPLK